MPRSVVAASIARRPLAANTSRLFHSNTVCVVVLLALLSLSSATMANEHAKSVIAGNNRIAGQLYQYIAKPNENLVFSPLSLHSVLSLVQIGAGGGTEKALMATLNNPDKEKTAAGYAAVMEQLNNVENVTLRIANRVYVKENYTLKAKFKEIATEQFKAGAENVDFVKPGAAGKMNAWVEQKTHGKIGDLIAQGDLDDDTRMVLINAVYFKGDWLDQFKKEATRKDKFYVSETETVDCDMMFRSGKYNYKDDAALDAQVIEIPYKNRALSMIVVLPHGKTGIGELEKKLVNVDVNELVRNMYNVEVDLSLPKFKIESTIQLNEPLQKMGLGEAFTSAADFSDLLDSPEPLQISKVVQKAFIEVNEEGAEAAAATGAIAVTFSLMVTPITPPKQFRADHPFVYLLRRSETVLFEGKLSSTQD